MNGSITNMVNATADSATLVRLLAGVQYIITVQAFADLPSAISNSVTITLEGKVLVDQKDKIIAI